MNKKLVVFVLDETGSMAAIKDQTISGFNEYLDTLRLHGKAARMTLTRFNSMRTETAHVDQPVKDIPHLTPETYQPAELTPLYDAIGAAIRATEEALARRADSPDVLLAILTDGQENFSREFTRYRIFELIREKETAGWAFAYLGANQDSWAEAEKVGIPTGAAANFAATPTGAVQAYAMSCAVADSFLAGDYTSSSSLSDVSGTAVERYVGRIQRRVQRDKRRRAA